MRLEDITLEDFGFPPFDNVYESLGSALQTVLDNSVYDTQLGNGSIVEGDLRDLFGVERET